MRSPITWAALGMTATAAPLDILLLVDTASEMETALSGVSDSIPYITDYLRVVHPDAHLGIIGMSAAGPDGSCVQLSAPLAPISHWQQSATQFQDPLSIGGHKSDDEYFKALLSVVYDRGRIRWTQNGGRDRLVLVVTNGLPGFDTHGPSEVSPIISIGEEGWDAWNQPCSQLPNVAPQVVRDALMKKRIEMAVLLMEADVQQDVPIIEKNKCDDECSLFAYKFVHTIESYVNNSTVLGEFEASASEFGYRETETSTAMILVNQEPVMDTNLRGADSPTPEPSPVLWSDGQNTWWWVITLGRVAQIPTPSPLPETTTAAVFYGRPRSSGPIWIVTLGRKNDAHRETERTTYAAQIPRALPMAGGRHRWLSGAAVSAEHIVADAESKLNHFEPTPNPLSNEYQSMPGYGTWWWIVTVGRAGPAVKPADSVSG